MLPGGMGGMEVVLIALLALVVVGPKDLPILMRRLARWVNHVRGMAAEFRSSFDEMARQSELDELRREVEALRRGDPLEPIRTHLDSTMDEINAGLRADGTPDAAADPYLPSFEPEGVAPVEPYLPYLEAAPEPAMPDLTPPPAAPQIVVPEPAQTQLLPEKPAKPRARRKAPAPIPSETAPVAVHEGEA
jgi:sec-independent protein translocase protein TatB